VSAAEAKGSATQISSRRYDEQFFALPQSIQQRIEAKIDAMGRKLATFPHYRMEGVDTFRLRVGDYRIIYQFDLARNELFLVALGHRSKVYKQ
jgi:mRNA interferase RelE/StbE